MKRQILMIVALEMIVRSTTDAESTPNPAETAQEEPKAEEPKAEESTETEVAPAEEKKES